MQYIFVTINTYSDGVAHRTSSITSLLYNLPHQLDINDPQLLQIRGKSLNTIQCDRFIFDANGSYSNAARSTN